MTLLEDEGFGLSSVYDIVRRHGGFVRVPRGRDADASFELYFPRVERLRTEPERSSATEAPHADGETVLLVDEDVAVLEVTRQLLAGGGYRVLSASSVEEATKTAREHRAPIDLLATDVVLPGMSGLALAAELKRTRPRMKVLYLSGYTDEAIAERGLIAQGANRLQKPYRRVDLLEAVRRAIDAADA